MSNKTYLLFADVSWVRKGNVLLMSGKGHVQVLKVYRNTRWRRFIGWLGFNARINQCKVKPHEIART